MSEIQAAHQRFPVQVVGAAIFDSLAAPTTILLGRRSAPTALAGMWEFPGGKVEPGEEARQALARELVEELGVEVILGREIAGDHRQGWPLNQHAAMRVFCAEIAAGDPAPLQDHSSLGWFCLDDSLLELPWIPADIPIVKGMLELLATRE